jgi:hypothetical protein
MRNIASGSVSNTGSNSPVVAKKLSPAVSASTSPLQGNTSANNTHNETGKMSATAHRNRDNSYPDLPEMIAGLSLADNKTIDGVPVVTDVTRGRLKLKTQTVAPAETAESSTETSTYSTAVGSVSCASAGSRPAWTKDRLRVASQESVSHSPQHEHLRLADRPPPGTIMICSKHFFSILLRASGKSRYKCAAL